MSFSFSVRRLLTQLRLFAGLLSSIVTLRGGDVREQ